MDLPGAENGLLGLTELHAPFGVPDLTVVVGDPAARRARLRLRVPPLLNEVDAGIASVAPADGGATIRQLAARVSWPVPTVERRLRSLLRTSALREIQDGRFVRPAALQPIGRIYAVELKVDDWKRALVQCRTYRTWADSYVLIMQRVPAPSLDHLRREVHEDRGGLIVDGEWLVHPRVSPLARSRRMWASEHVVAARQQSARPTPPVGRTAEVPPAAE